MKTVKILFYILLTVVGVVLIAYLLAASVGLIIDLAIAAAFIGGFVALVRYGIQKHHERTHPLRQDARATKAADRALKDIERTINKH
jgi:hypothetical protein